MPAILRSTRFQEETHEPLPKQALLSRALLANERGREFLFSIQREDFHWCGELESNPTVTAEYVFLNQILQRKLGERQEKIINYFFKLQNPDGSWSIARRWNGDISTTAEVYLALKILGINSQDPLYGPLMLRAESFILENGGLEKVRIFTRIFFAMFGLMPWSTVPALPPEIILLPAVNPINVYSLSSWARGTMIPLFVIVHHRPVFALPNGKLNPNDWLDRLWINPNEKTIPYLAPWPQLLKENGLGWKSFFSLTDTLLKGYEVLHSTFLRRKALDQCVQWILDRQEESGDWAGIFPPMLNGMIALTLEGYGLDSHPISKGMEAMDNFSWEDPDGYRIQPCVSPVWDTALTTICLLDSGVNPKTPELEAAVQWVLKRQLIVSHGDWKVLRPQLPSGGWSFEYSNSWYPDVDDTAAVLLSLLKQNPRMALETPVQRAIEWILGMQNKDGGWAAFDVESDKLFLNSIPFADIDALCDPSTPDVTGRVIESLGLLLSVFDPLLTKVNGGPINEDLYSRILYANQCALSYLKNAQEKEGCWFGRWGVNYIYGTSNVLCGLSTLRISGMDPMIRPALEWLKTCQNSDGGWGESVASYLDRSLMGKGESTPSQTAWAVMGLLTYLSPMDQSIQDGIRWLVKNQISAPSHDSYHAGTQLDKPKGSTWEEFHSTGTGFPKHFYLRYHLYRHYFPMMALGRFIKAHQS